MKQKDVHLFVFDSLSDWEVGYAVAGINNPQFQKNPGQYRVQTVSIGKAPVVTVGGIRIQPDLALEDLSPSDSAMFILLGGAAWDEGQNREASNVARRFLDSNTLTAAICGATSGLAREGLLDNRKHTSNAPGYLAATQ